jgi:hypothetical protein
LFSVKPAANLTDSRKVSIGLNWVPEEVIIGWATNMRKLFEPKSTAAIRFEPSGDEILGEVGKRVKPVKNKR